MPTAAGTTVPSVVRPATEGHAIGRTTAVRILETVGRQRERGALLRLIFNVSDVSDSTCAPGSAQVDVWHCDAAGAYSGVDPVSIPPGKNGCAGIRSRMRMGAGLPLYPGWYSGQMYIFLQNSHRSRLEQGYEFIAAFLPGRHDRHRSRGRPYASRDTVTP
jgi:hypothetical protein